MRSYVLFVLSCLFKSFAVILAGMLFSIAFVLFIILMGQTKDLSIIDFLNAVEVAAKIVMVAFVFSLVFSKFVRREFARMMRFDEIRKTPFHAKQVLGNRRKILN